jgi:hypothetical protein
MEFYSRHQENVNGNGNVQHRNRASGEGFNIKVNNCMKKKKE